MNLQNDPEAFALMKFGIGQPIRRVEDAGHNVQGDNPAGLVRELEPFLERCFDAPPSPT